MDNKKVTNATIQSIADEYGITVDDLKELAKKKRDAELKNCINRVAELREKRQQLIDEIQDINTELNDLRIRKAELYAEMSGEPVKKKSSKVAITTVVTRQAKISTGTSQNQKQTRHYTNMSPVFVYDLVNGGRCQEYPSLNMLFETTGLKMNNIHACLKNHQNSYKGKAYSYTQLTQEEVKQHIARLQLKNK